MLIIQWIKLVSNCKTRMYIVADIIIFVYLYFICCITFEIKDYYLHLKRHLNMHVLGEILLLRGALKTYSDHN